MKSKLQFFSFNALAALWLFFSSMNAQTLTPFVISSAGNFSNAPVGSLSWTLGETITETYHKNSNYLTQGFHQPTTIIVTGLEAEKNEAVFPNPVRDILNLNLVEAGDYLIELYDLKGVRVVASQVTAGQSGREHQIEMSDFPVAMYLLRVTNSTSKKIFTVRIDKI